MVYHLPLQSTQQGLKSTPEPSHVMFDLVVDQSDFPSTRGIHASRAVVGTQIVGSPKVVRELMDEGVDLEGRRIIGYLFNI